MMLLPLLSTLVAMVPAVASPASLFSMPHPQQDDQRPSEDLLIATIPDAGERQSFEFMTFSSDGKSGFYNLWRGGKHLFLRDTDSLGEFNDFESSLSLGLYHSPFMAARSQPKEYFLVLPSSKMVGPYEDIDYVGCEPHSTSVLWLARRSDKVFLIEKDQEVASYDAIKNVTWSKDGGALAFQARIGTKWVVASRSGHGPEYDAILWGPILSADGSVLSYCAQRGSKKLVVVGEMESAEYDRIEDVVRDSLKRRVAYRAFQGEKMFVVVGTKQGQAYVAIDPPVISSDGEVTAYRAQREPLGKLFLVIGDRESEPYDRLENPQFSPSGKGIAYKAEVGHQQFVVVGERRGKAYEEVGEPIWSPDGKTVAYAARSSVQGKKTRWVVVGTQERFKHPDAWNIEGLVWSADGSSLAYVVHDQSGDKRVAINGTLGKPFLVVHGPFIPPRGRNFAYVATRKKGTDLVSVLVRGNKESQDYAFIDYDRLTFTADGTDVAFHACTDRKQYYVEIGHKVHGPYDWVEDRHSARKICYIGSKKGVGKFVIEEDRVLGPFPHDVRVTCWFYPDGTQVAHVVEEGVGHKEKSRLFVGSEEGEAFDLIRTPRWSPDGKEVAYMAMNRSGKEWKCLVVRGKTKSQEFDKIDHLTFSHDGRTLGFVAWDGPQIWWKVMK